MTQEEYGFKMAHAWSMKQVSDQTVMDAFEAGGNTKEWWHGWMAGLRKFYFVPFSFEKKGLSG